MAAFTCTSRPRISLRSDTKIVSWPSASLSARRTFAVLPESVGLRIRLSLSPTSFNFIHPRRRAVVCEASTDRENENKNVLDAFFLGKALAEVINERIESTVGEVLGSIGRFQAEQQKQVQEIQDEVLERAKRAKERAARETMESQGLVTSLTSTSIVESNTKSNENLSGFSESSMGGVVESSSSNDEEDGL